MHKVEFLDLHLHTKHSLASSKKGGIESFAEYAKLKGVDYVATGDILHGVYVKEASKLLKEESYGLYSFFGAKFFLSAEVSLIYRDEEKCRRIHVLVLFPDFRSVEKARGMLKDFGKLESDGRPILKIGIEDFFLMMKNISEDIILIPAHIWTPHFSLLGGKSGYDSIPTKIQKHISALETGLSSDPYMCSMNKDAASFSFVSFSDAHSPQLIGREATIVNENVETIVKLKNILEERRIYGTVEFFPQEGKYFLTGHRKCSFKTNKQMKICPVCQKQLTEGVFNRIESLPRSDRKYDKKSFYVLPVEEYVKMFVATDNAKHKKSDALREMLEKMPEMEIKVTADEKTIAKTFTQEFADFCITVRKQRVKIEEGYDGVYGKIKSAEER
ncbi:MAG: endonuclease Q family protein [bacterium]|nr:endonuclease Q family protein [bacterium]